MAVAVKPSPTGSAESPVNRLAVGSLVGALYVLGSLAIIFYAIPALWPAVGAVEQTLRLLVMLAAAGGLIYTGARMVGTDAPKGLRAGVAVGCFAILVSLLVARMVGGWLEVAMGTNSSPVGLALVGFLALGMIVFFASLFFRASAEKSLIALEEQGWFSMTPYKRSQGLKVRRGTIVGVLVLVGSGVFTMVTHNTVVNYGWESWQIRIPFSSGEAITLLPHLQFTLPLVLAALGFWLAYRLVNFPVFADFLIATEAELNKVSWTTQKRLVQDTIVVLTTMAFITIFLFLVDWLWYAVLSNRFIQVLQTGSPSISRPADDRTGGEQDW